MTDSRLKGDPPIYMIPPDVPLALQSTKMFYDRQCSGNIQVTCYFPLTGGIAVVTCERGDELQHLFLALSECGMGLRTIGSHMTTYTGILRLCQPLLLSWLMAGARFYPDL